MKNLKLYFILIAGVLLTTTSCKKKEEKSAVVAKEDLVKFDSTQIPAFIAKYPEFKEFESELKEVYQKRNYHYVWYDKDGRIDFAEVLYNRINQIKNDGVQAQIPYKKQIDELFDQRESKKAGPESDFLVSSMYFFYTKNVLQGLDPEKSKQTGWFLPRENVSYVDYLDSLLKDPYLIKKDKGELIGQYYNLKKALNKFREIQKAGSWGTIQLPEGVKSLKPGDSSSAIVEIRKKLFLIGDLKSNSGKSIFDDDLKEALTGYESRHHRKFDNLIGPSIVKEMNVSIEDRIKTIIVNMERCRWINPETMNSKELVAVNIPSYRMQYFKDGKKVLESNVVVGKELNKTVVFSGEMSYLVFSPYWNIPPSIIKNEIKPAMDADSDYLAKHNMEWNNGNVRQKPGPNNSLGLVKFMFPNSNNIYLHDTPAKSLFGRDARALSHGCVRVEKAKELANKILEGDKNWNAQKIDEAMNAGKEKHYTLNHKIPVYIAYFTAWADENGNVSFYQDIYKRDDKLAHLLYSEAN